MVSTREQPPFFSSKKTMRFDTCLNVKKFAVFTEKSQKILFNTIDILGLSIDID